MNKNFHYYTIKALAKTSGFSETESQLIAEYSQFVDDYSQKGYIYADATTEEAVRLGIAVKQGNFYKVKLVPTGFSMFDALELLLLPEIRVNVLIPFHFALSQRVSYENLFDPVEPARIGSSHLVSRLLEDTLVKLKTFPNQRRYYLIRIGILLHIFADTHAHQRFSGEYTRSVNNYKIDYAIHFYNKNDKKDETFKYKGARILYEKLPAIGHATVGHIPDDSYLMFNLSHQDGGKLPYQRDNRYEFLQTAEDIYKFLCTASEKVEPIPFDEISSQLLNGFYADNNSISTMNDIWSVEFKDAQFSYDKELILKRLFGDSKPNQEIEKLDLNKIKNLYKYDFLSDDSDLVLGDIYQVSKEFYDFTINAFKLINEIVDSKLRQ